MAPKASSSTVKCLSLAAVILLAVSASAQTSGVELESGAAAAAALTADAAARVAAQKVADEDEAQRLADGWGATKNIPIVKGTRVTPDYSYTPGHLCSPSDPNFKEYRYAEHIPYCNRNVTSSMKTTIAEHYDVPKEDWQGYEFDHLIPLAIGGDSSIDNIWPQPHGDPDGSNGKDRLEDLLYREMAAGKTTQSEAVQRIYAWFTGSEMAAEAVRITAR
ncbi:MAG: hypothetical protein ACHQ49_00170 [Elusimicrobiota bacterium]